MFLLIGGDSEIAIETAQQLRAAGFSVASTTRRFPLVADDRPFLDLSQPVETWEAPAGTRCACIFAAVARLAACQEDPIGSAYINVAQTLALCHRLIDLGIFVLFLSTNQVFSGDTAHTPTTAALAPVSEYGRQKAKTEVDLRDCADKGAAIGVLRFARVISANSPLIREWVGRLSVGSIIQAFPDMMVAPVPIEIAASAIIHILLDRAGGLFQLSGPTDVSYEAIARHVARRIGADDRLINVISARSADMPLGSTPAHTTLDSSLLRMLYRLSVPDPWQVIDAVVDRWMAARSA